MITINLTAYRQFMIDSW